MVAVTMDRTGELARWLLGAAGVVFVSTGAIFFLAPGYSADNFPWNVSPFVAQTIGGWAIGTGAIALDAARVWQVRRVFAALAFVWSFCVLELIVVIAFVGALRLEHPLTWPYLAALLLGLASAIAGIRLVAPLPQALRAGTPPVPGWLRAFTLLFLLIVVALTLATLFLDTSDGRFFPEPLTRFTAGAFAALFAALSVASVAMLLSKSAATTLEMAKLGTYLVVPITVAALLNLDMFDFAARPGGLLYIGAYVVVGVLAFLVWWRFSPAARPRRG
jgi:hypothetical protein